MVIQNQFYIESYLGGGGEIAFQIGIEEHRKKKNCILKFINNGFPQFVFVASNFGKNFIMFHFRYLTDLLRY